jgi:hypothetical protein
MARALYFIYFLNLLQYKNISFNFWKFQSKKFLHFQNYIFVPVILHLGLWLTFYKYD